MKIKSVEFYRKDNITNLKGIVLQKGDIVRVKECRFNPKYVDGKFKVITVSDSNVLAESLIDNSICELKTDDLFELVA